MAIQLADLATVSVGDYVRAYYYDPAKHLFARGFYAEGQVVQITTNDRGDRAFEIGIARDVWDSQERPVSEPGRPLAIPVAETYLSVLGAR